MQFDPESLDPEPRPHVQELSLQSCYMVGLQSLPPRLLQDMSALTLLTLSNCELDAVPPFITGAPALSVLNLAGAAPPKLNNIGRC